MKKKISVTVEEVSPSEFELSLSDVQQKINDWIKQYGPDARFDWDEFFSHPYSERCSPRYYIKVTRLETDIEYNNRMAEESRVQSERDARDLAEYNRLQAKFGVKK